MMPGNAWQSAEGNGFAVSDFTIDWDNRVMTCPTGATSLPWANETDQGGTPVVRVRFSMHDCKACPSRDLCTRGAKGRRITLRPREEHEALQRARQRQSTDEWQQRYAHRAGVEGTIAQGVKGFGLRRSRYRGTAKTHLQHLLIAAAMNLTRRRLACRNTHGPDAHRALRRSASGRMMRLCHGTPSLPSP
ncbi:transposase [Nonomuraea polychroma]|uniref:transposase n=1 Tax=Nonomuraea polychroma TaxID=46176 RepID=UPI003D917E22